MKRGLLVVLSLIILVSFTTAITSSDVTASPDRNTEYAEKIFSDVPTDAWYGESIRMVHEEGIMIGKSADIFDPDSSITVAQFVTVVARLHAWLNPAETSFAAGSPWYKPYIDYCNEAGIFIPDTTDVNAVVKGADLVSVLFRMLPEDCFADVEPQYKQIDGLSPDRKLYNAIYSLYKSGVLKHIMPDDTATFEPEKPVTRYEMAVILANIIEKSIYDETDMDGFFSQLKRSKINDCVAFGAYEQDNDITNGKEKIEWVVIDKQGNRVLLLSRNVIEAAQYNKTDDPVDWETCTLRAWLNNEFINEAFNQGEQSLIDETTVNVTTLGYGEEIEVDGSNSVTDKLFLLSWREAYSYYEAGARMISATKYSDYVINKNYELMESPSQEWVTWWLRTTPFDPATPPNRAWYYKQKDSYFMGAGVQCDNIGVRPAFWVTIPSGD